MYTYLIAKQDGIYEIVKVDEKINCVVVQTNIRTHEKALQAQITWLLRELGNYERQTNAGIRDRRREDGQHPDESC